eukprot:TRINITY_DN76452_c0_g1_i1.p1 TRINITY_DN76452_c0_g1~~TRINITY_DN76452_c0_g1_i1.p1  ORF type:complete len:307 (-),score=16.00 TRINITY_DN76452_c0_g1_i1:102-1022(-)
MLETQDILKPLAFQCGESSCISASYVDNMYFAGHDVSGATRNADEFEKHLRQTWGQRFKTDSCTVLASRGCPILQPASERWRLVEQDAILGWTISGSGNPRSSWILIKSKMWRAFYLQLRNRGWQKLGLRRRLVVLTRCIENIFLRGMGVTPYSTTLKKEIDIVQRQMVASTMCIAKRDGEDIAAFIRRRAAQARAKCQQLGWWSCKWASQVLRWDEHLLRDYDRQKRHYDGGLLPALCFTSWSWAARLRCYHDSLWLRERRETFIRNAALQTTSTRTRTRASRGRVFPRWEESTHVAEHALQAQS